MTNVSQFYRLLFFISFIALLGITCQPKTSKNTADLKAIQHFLNQFKELENDTHVIYSYQEFIDKVYYKGTELNGKDTQFFKVPLKKWSNDSPAQFYACYKFKIDTFRYGLIARIPTETSPCDPTLCLFDYQNGILYDQMFIFETMSDTFMKTRQYIITSHDLKGKLKSIAFQRASLITKKRPFVVDSTAVLTTTILFGDGGVF